MRECATSDFTDPHRFGLNITRDGQLYAVTPAFVLDLPQVPKRACEKTTTPVAVVGAEDPRVFWTVRPSLQQAAHIRMRARLP